MTIPGSTAIGEGDGRGYPCRAGAQLLINVLGSQDATNAYLEQLAEESEPREK